MVISMVKSDRMRIWLRAIRQNNNMTQEEVAQMSKISRSYYVQLETRGESKFPRPATAKRIAKVLDFDWTVFYENNGAG